MVLVLTSLSGQGQSILITINIIILSKGPTCGGGISKEECSTGCQSFQLGSSLVINQALAYD